MDTTQPTTAPRRASRPLAALLATVLALTAGLVTAGSAPVAAADPTTGLTWKMSEQVFTSSSLSPAHTTAAPATKTDAGFSFPEVTDVSVDALTGAASATFPGSFDLGNTNQGNYRIRIADPTVDLAAGRATGTVTADVSYALAPAVSGDPHSFTTPVEAVVADLTLAAGTVVDTGSHLSFTATPDFVLRTDLAPEANPNGYRQFPQPLLDALSPQLISHFRETNTGQTAKAPSPVTVSFAYTPEAPPTGLTWKMSQQAFTSSSLSPAHTTAAPATKTDAGFSFPETSSAIFDPETGVGQIDLTGSFDLGNTNQGNYRIRIADPSVLLHGDGTGAVGAAVSYALFNATTQVHEWTTPTRVPVATLTFPEGAITVDGDQLSFIVTPDFVLRTDLAPEANPNGYRQFPQPFLDALSPQLISHFRETNTGQPAKAPSPVGVNVTFETPEAPDPDATLVRLLYGVSIGRDAGEGEIAYWTGRLDAGSSPRAVARSISRSSEARRVLVRAGYSSALDRSAGSAEVDYWAGRIASGLTAEGLAVELLGSPEALRAWGGSPEGLADAVYQFALGRDGDAAGLEYWGDRFERAGTTNGRRAVVRSFYRLQTVTTYWVRSSLQRSCGLDGADTSTTAALEAVWAQDGRDPVQQAATTVVVACIDRPLPD